MPLTPNYQTPKSRIRQNSKEIPKGCPRKSPEITPFHKDRGFSSPQHCKFSRFFLLGLQRRFFLNFSKILGQGKLHLDRILARARVSRNLFRNLGWVELRGNFVEIRADLDAIWVEEKLRAIASIYPPPVTASSPMSRRQRITRNQRLTTHRWSAMRIACVPCPCPVRAPHVPCACRSALIVAETTRLPAHARPKACRL